MTRFTNFALAAATSFGLALTPVPAAAADGEDIAAAIAGIALLGLIANSASNRDRNTTITTTRSGLSPNNRVIEGELYRDRNRANGNRNFKRIALPQRCAQYLRTSRGTQVVYAEGCLDRRYQHANKLPQRCERLVRTNRGLRTVFTARCLSRDGWRVALR